MIWRGKLAVFVYLGIALAISYVLVMAHADGLIPLAWIGSAVLAYFVMRKGGLKT